MVQILGLMLFGGGVTQLRGAVGIAVLTMILLAVGIFRGMPQTFMRAPRIVRVVLILPILLPLLQLVPLPPSVWQELPGQKLRVSAYFLVGIADSWQPLSLAAANTNYSILMAIAFVTLTLALMTQSRESLFVVLRFILAILLFGLLVGVVQVASGGTALRIYAQANHGALLGFFANKNHMALMLSASLPIAALLTDMYDRKRRGISWIFTGYWAVAVVAVLMTNSRAGIMMSLLATLAIAARTLRDQPRRYLIGVPVAVLAAAAFLLSLPQVEAAFSRFDTVGDDLRWRFAQQSAPLFREYWLFGAGSGSFSRLYAVHENLLWVKPTFVNHLHNDFYQVAIEQGVAGVAAIVITLLALTVGAASAWRKRPEDRDATFSACIVVALFALHSIVDYPLRRPATFPVLAIAIALIWWQTYRGSQARDGSEVQPFSQPTE